MKQKACKDSGNSYAAGKIVVVAVKASKDITKDPILWALTHIVQPGDCIKLLVVIPSHTSSKRIWDFSRFASDCTTGQNKSLSGTSADEKEDVVNSCSQMVLQLREVYDPEKIKVRLKIVSSSPCSVVAAEAKRIQSNWVILDKQLKFEKKCCMDELKCNIVVIKKSGPEVLRLNFVNNPRMESAVVCSLMPEPESSPRLLKSNLKQSNMIRGPVVTPASSPEQESFLTRTDVGTSSISSSSDIGSSPFLLPRNHGNMKKEYLFDIEGNNNFNKLDSNTKSEKLSSCFTSSERLYNKALLSTYGALLENLSKFDQEADIGGSSYKLDLNLSRSVREAISLSRNSPLGHPPLCSVCQHRAPVFGNPPKWFTYAELKIATSGFSKANFLAEGGFGSVFRGVLTDGQVVAVKQHKYASSQGDPEFCSEVEVLSCAQHRNVVMLIGFCVEDGRRLLVYEYICNGSLDLHLYGHDQKPLGWSARQKIAVGAARGLRYLHEECRVGCIVHRDMRPNNILLTHDFEPLVGDFGLARWQPDGSKEVETRVLGTFGYLAPEYAQSGQITDKADVYSFGVVLVELVTGRKAIDLNRPKGQQCLTEWARPLLEKLSIKDLVDPRLRNCYTEQDVYNMLQCASLCIKRDPHSRPRMSQVLRILEGDAGMNGVKL